jgi:hypothetical protein
MPVTQQIIKTIVRQQIKEELVPTNQKIDSLARDTDKKFATVNQRFDVVNTKLDKVMEIVVDFAGQVKKFDEEQTVLSDHVSNLTDRVEKIELAIN